MQLYYKREKETQMLVYSCKFAKFSRILFLQNAFRNLVQNIKQVLQCKLTNHSLQLKKIVLKISYNIFSKASFTLLKSKSFVNVTWGFLTGPLWLTTVFLAKLNGINYTVYMATTFTSCVIKLGNLVLIVMTVFENDTVY